MFVSRAVHSSVNGTTAIPWRSSRKRLSLLEQLSGSQDAWCPGAPWDRDVAHAAISGTPVGVSFTAKINRLRCLRSLVWWWLTPLGITKTYEMKYNSCVKTRAFGNVHTSSNNEWFTVLGKKLNSLCWLYFYCNKIIPRFWISFPNSKWISPKSNQLIWNRPVVSDFIHYLHLLHFDNTYNKQGVK